MENKLKHKLFTFSHSTHLFQKSATGASKSFLKVKLAMTHLVRSFSVNPKAPYKVPWSGMALAAPASPGPRPCMPRPPTAWVRSPDAPSSPLPVT